MIYQFEVLTAHKDFIPGGGQRIFQAEEFCFRGKVEWTRTTFAFYGHFIGAVTNELARNGKLAWCTQSIIRRQLPASDGSAINQYFITHHGLHFATHAEVIVEG